MHFRACVYSANEGIERSTANKTSLSSSNFPSIYPFRASPRHKTHPGPLRDLGDWQDREKRFEGTRACIRCQKYHNLKIKTAELVRGDDARAPQAQVVLQSDFDTLHLAVLAHTPQLPTQLVALCQSSRSERVAFRDQTYQKNVIQRKRRRKFGYLRWGSPPTCHHMSSPLFR